MPEQIRCPDCAATLRVPESLLGSLVKCPKCHTTFTADLAPPQPIRHEETPTYRPAPDEEEAGDDYEMREDEIRPRRRRRRRRFRSGAAESAVSGPAISLMVTSGLSIAGGLVDLLFRIVNVAGGGLDQGLGGNPNSAEYRAGAMFGGCFDLVSLLVAIVIIVGAVRMKGLQNHGFALTSCILAMLPLHCCCLLGLPFGIWGLVVLNNPDVKDAFS